MRIIRLQSEGFKRLLAVDITPEGDLVEVRGQNGNGKSSVLDSILAALGGKAVAPEKPVREGEEAAVIRLELGEGKVGELVVTRYFTAHGTTSLKVTTPDGASYGSAQTTLDNLVGHISFDPLKFRDLKPEEQAEELRRLVDIVDPETGEEIDLAALEAANKVDFDARRDVNRAGNELAARIKALGGSAFIPEDAPDRDAIVAAMSNAGETNSKIADEARRREIFIRERDEAATAAYELGQEIEEVRKRLGILEARAEKASRDAHNMSEDISAWPELDPRVDTVALAEQLAEADRIEANRRHNATRAALMTEFDELGARSKALTAAMKERDATRAKAIAAVKMPVEGLELRADDEGNLSVYFGGVPFSHASDAERMRVSVAVAMAANPELRVIRLKDASLLDKKAIEILREMATDNDFQVWAEFVGDEGSGIIMEAGEVRGAEKPEPLPKPKQRKAAEDGVESEEVTGGPGAEVSDDGRAGIKAGPTTLFERMAETATPKPRPQRMTEFVTKPKGE